MKAICSHLSFSHFLAVFPFEFSLGWMFYRQSKLVDHFNGHQLGLEELGDVDDEGKEDGGEDEGVEVHPGGVVELLEAELYWPPDGHQSLGHDARDEVGLAAQQDVLEGVPEVGEEEDVRLVLEVQVELEAVNDEEVEDALVEVLHHLEHEDDDDGVEIAEDAGKWPVNGWKGCKWLDMVGNGWNGGK